ncbi:MAG: 1,4-alpha-glucan branching protein GlgB [Clostridia bacterium]|nr:1,4-alpha-glucan branching protein GlgB [Clostridia bacterium]
MRYVAPNAEVREWFHQGESRRAYEMLGAHPVEQDGVAMWHFAVWAPNARAVSLIGEFCQWDKNACPMNKQFDGTWEIRIPASTFDPASDPERYGYEDAAKKLKTYKYAIEGADGIWRDKADPFGFAMQNRPNTASVMCDLEGYQWNDGQWMEARRDRNVYTSPMNIYEVHLGSWRREGSTKQGGGLIGDGKDDTGRMLTYTEIADKLIPYVLEMGYTHVEFLPVMEHPLDMSWGYQVGGYYAATARYGEPHDLMQLIDRCHQAGIGVILDWVPAHFPKDISGLGRFDGTCCFEHPDHRRGEMPQWGTYLFDFARGEVRSFLLSNACFWLDWYHADGLRVDAVSSMLYYDFCRDGMEWLPNQFGGRENLEAISFFQKLNATVRHDFPGAMTIAEESHNFPGVTHPASEGGLDFTFKWNMGWMNDTLAYIKNDPIYRKWHHDKLTFSLFYAFNEDFILPFSHDEVVHGKLSMVDKQPGDLWQKFAGLRALYGYTMAHPGKKLLFMGGEFGQFMEWRYDDQLDWFLLMYEKHPELQKCVRDLNHFYKNTPAMYEVDKSWDGFQWSQANDQNNSVVAFIRTDKKGKSILCVTNFTPQYIPAYRLGLPMGGKITEIFNTDSETYAGSGKGNGAKAVKVEDIPQGEFQHSVEIVIPPLATMYFKYDKVKPKVVKPKAEAGEEKPKRTRKPCARKPKAEAPAPEGEKKPVRRTRKKAAEPADTNGKSAE